MTILFGALALVVACNTACNGLHILPSRHRNHNLDRLPAAFDRSSFTTSWAFPSESDGVLENENENENETDSPDSKESETTLKLRGEFSVASANLPKTSVGDAVGFFRTKDARDLFMSGGGEKPCRQLTTITTAQLEDWKSRCSALGARQPDENDSVISVSTQGIQFPGLRVESNALIGAKFVETEEGSNTSGENAPLPRYEFVLLDTEQIVSGIAPAVWIFNKLTGGGGDSTTFDSLSTVAFEENENGTVVVRSNARLSLGVSFPRFLLKILPGDKQTIEERGGKSITKALVKDVSRSVKAFEKAYLERFGFDASTDPP